MTLRPLTAALLPATLAAALAACSSEEPGDGADRTIAEAPVGNANVMVDPTDAAKSDGVVPRPDDQAQLDRMITAGYTPHGTHMHPPGVNECPLSKGNEAVM